MILFNHGKNVFKINNKDRIAQMVLTPIIKAEFEEVTELPKSLRGEVVLALLVNEKLNFLKKY